MPTICSKDVLFHVLYGGNRALVIRLIESSVISISRVFGCDVIDELLQGLRPTDEDSLDKLRAKFVLLLNEDEHMRKIITEPFKDFSYMKPVNICKARIFYDEIYEVLIPTFVQDESVSLEKFVDDIRSAYLCS